MSPRWPVKAWLRKSRAGVTIRIVEPLREGERLFIKQRQLENVLNGFKDAAPVVAIPDNR